MGSHSIRRTRDCGPKDKAGRTGFVLPMVAFLSFILSGICFGMVMMAQAHMNMVRFRKYSLLLDYASENGIKAGAGRLFSAVSAGTSPAEIDASMVDLIREGTEEGTAALIEAVNPGAIPLGTEGGADDLSWRSETLLSRQGLVEAGPCLKASIRFEIRASGWSGSFPAGHASSLEGTIEVLAGRLPLASIPLTLIGPRTASEVESCLDANNVSIMRPAGPLTGLPPHPSVTDVCPADPGEAIAAALGLKLFKPQDLGAAQLRAILGLEASDEPLPDGVYPVVDDLGFTSVFVQGDLLELIPAIGGDEQFILFRTETGEWLLRSDPGLGRSSFSGPEGGRSFETAFGGYVIVNGGIGSLCAGRVTDEGSVAASTDGDRPSILNGTGLTIVSSESVSITSSLIVQGAEWKNGFPFLEDSRARLTIASTGRDLVSGEERESGISVSGETPAEVKIQAAVLSGNGTFEIHGSNKSVEIAGGLHVSGLDSGGNSLAISPDQRLPVQGSGAGTIATTKNYLFVSAVRPTAWKEGPE